MRVRCLFVPPGPAPEAECPVNSFRLSHLADHVLLRELHVLVSQDRATTAALLAHLGEVDERRLFLARAYSSMYLYCVGELGMSEDVAYKRITVARLARQFHAILPAISEGRLNLSAALMLAPHLTTENAEGLLAAAAHKRRDEVLMLLAERFPQPDVATLIQPVDVAALGRTCIRPVAATAQLAPGRVVPLDSPESPESMGPLSSEPVGPDAPVCEPAPISSPRAEAPAHPRVTPLSPGRFALQVTVNQRTHELLQRAKALLGHAQPECDVAGVLERALEGLVTQLEKQKYAKTSRKTRRRSHANGRYVPAEIKRAVHERDGGRCTFVGDNQKRCDARDRLEFDHVQPIARGGQTTVGNLRLRCRAHNQFEAERVYGAEFMRAKRLRSRDTANAASAG